MCESGEFVHLIHIFHGVDLVHTSIYSSQEKSKQGVIKVVRRLYTEMRAKGEDNTHEDLPAEDNVVVEVFCMRTRSYVQNLHPRIDGVLVEHT